MKEKRKEKGKKPQILGTQKLKVWMDSLPSSRGWICDGMHHICRQRVKNTCQELCFLCPRTTWKLNHGHMNEQPLSNAAHMEEKCTYCMQTERNSSPPVNRTTMVWNVTILGGLINVWGGTSCNRQRSFKSKDSWEYNLRQDSCGCLSSPS